MGDGDAGRQAHSKPTRKRAVRAHRAAGPFGVTHLCTRAAARQPPGRIRGGARDPAAHLARRTVHAVGWLSTNAKWRAKCALNSHAVFVLTSSGFEEQQEREKQTSRARADLNSRTDPSPPHRRRFRRHSSGTTRVDPCTPPACYCAGWRERIRVDCSRARLGRFGDTANTSRSPRCGGGHQLQLAGVDQLDEVKELQPHSITHEGDAHVAMKVATHFRGLRAKTLRQASEWEIRTWTQQLKRSAREHVRGVSRARAGTARQPVDALPELGASLTHVRSFDDVRGAVEDGRQLIARQVGHERDDSARS